MEKQDARSLPGEAQEDLRRRVVEAVQKGLSQTEAARVFGIARGTVSRWMGLVERVGRRALKARRRGRPAVSRLAPHQAATTVRHIVSGCPDQLSMPFALWTREALQELLSRKFDLLAISYNNGDFFDDRGIQINLIFNLGPIDVNICDLVGRSRDRVLSVRGNLVATNDFSSVV